MLTRLLHPSFLLFFLLLLNLSCAGQRAPEGGPVDTDPPVILHTVPSPNTTHFSGDRIVLEFDEYVDRRSVEQSIFISPPVGSLEYDWSGREVEIRFAGRLRENTTYVVTVGTDVADLRNRNKMAQAFSLAFSTGGEIDFGAIEGMVYPLKPNDPVQGVLIFAYRIDSLDPDTLDPRHTQPQYVTQTGLKGEFALRHLALGSYRVMAVRDAFRNLLYDPEVDDFGVPSAPLHLSPGDTLLTDVQMQLAKEDTTAPRLLKATSLHSTHLLLEFSEPIHHGTMPLDGIEIIDTVSLRHITVRSIIQAIAKPTNFLIVTDPVAPDSLYRITVAEGRDGSGNRISPLARSMTFTGSSAVDSIGLRLASVSIADSARSVVLHPEIQILLSTGVNRESAAVMVALESGRGERVPVTEEWFNDGGMVLQPLRLLVPKSWYTLRIDAGMLRDHFGNPSRDSLRILAFETIDPDLLTGIDGRIADDFSADTLGMIHLFAEHVTKKELKPYHLILPGPGRFGFQNILDGQYILHGYRDRNRNKRYDAGLPFPFERSERFVRYPDTLKVRARWPLEGVVIEFR